MLKKIKSKIKNRKLKKAIEKEYRQNEKTSFDDSIISWVAYEYPKHERGTLWKVLSISFVVVAIALGIFFNAVTFSLAIASFALVYYLLHKENPKKIEIKISNIGIKIGNIKYPYSEIKEFWIIYEPPFVRTLNLRVRSGLINEVKVELGGQDPAQLREILMAKIKELEGQKEGLTDTILRLFKL